MNKKILVTALIALASVQVHAIGNNPASVNYVNEAVAAAIAQTTYTVGQQALGGTVFWVDSTGKHGLVSALADASTGVVWGVSSGVSTGTYASGIFAGAMNTTLSLSVQISEGNLEDTALFLCPRYAVQPDGVTPCAIPNAVPPEGGTCYADWYLPSIYEMDQLYFKRATVGAFDELVGYWSSSFNNPSFSTFKGIWFINFADTGEDHQGLDGSTVSHNVRCIRQF